MRKSPSNRAGRPAPRAPWHPLFLSAVGAAIVGVASVAQAAPPQASPADPALPTQSNGWDIPGRIVVDAHDDLDESEIQDLAGDFGLSLTETVLEDDTRINIADVDASSVQGLVERLSKDDRIENVEPLSWVRAFYEPNDPLYKQQWHMDRVGAPDAWDFGSGLGVTVAVVDTGIACETHGPFNKGTDLAQTRCVPGWNLVDNSVHANDDQGHGSHVAGTIAQSTNNGVGVAGLAFNARLMPVKVLNGQGWGTTADVADGIRWAADNGAHVINLSLGGPRNSKVLQDAVDHARASGVVVVAAAGNSGGAVGFPGASEGVIGVSATGKDNRIAKFSSRGKGVDIAAPGVDVVQQTICNGGRDKCEQYSAFNGTSMATPHVAGVAAMLVGQGVTDVDSVEAALYDSAKQLDDSEKGKLLYGAGLLQADDAVRAISIKQIALRLGFLLAFALVVSRGASAARKGLSRPGFWIAGLATGPGLLFFAPWVLSRGIFGIDLAARPLADWDMLIGASLHNLLPLANGLVALGATALCFGSARLRPLAAGVSIGTAAYLASVAALGHHAGPFGVTVTSIWCAANALVCLWFARANLTETKS